MTTTGSKQPRAKASPGRGKTTKTTKAPRKTATRKGAKRKTPRITPEARYRMIAEAAYLRAEQAGFGGDPVEYWLTAEREIDAMLADQAGGTAQ